MLRLFWMLRGKLNNWLFARAFKRAPAKRLGEIWVKEVQGNLYAVNQPLDGTQGGCQCFQCKMPMLSMQRVMSYLNWIVRALLLILGVSFVLAVRMFINN